MFPKGHKDEINIATEGSKTESQYPYVIVVGIRGPEHNESNQGLKMPVRSQLGPERGPAQLPLTFGGGYCVGMLAVPGASGHISVYSPSVLELGQRHVCTVVLK